MDIGCFRVRATFITSQAGDDVIGSEEGACGLVLIINTFPVCVAPSSGG